MIKEAEDNFTIEFFNEKFLNFLNFSNNPLHFKQIDAAMKGFYFRKIKANSFDTCATSIRIDNLEKGERTPFGSLSEVLEFYKQCKFCSMASFIQKEKNFNGLRRLKMNLKRENLENNNYYYFTFQKIEKMLTLREKADSKNRLLSAFTHELKTPLNGSIPPLEEAKICSSNSTKVYVINFFIITKGLKKIGKIE